MRVTSGGDGASELSGEHATVLFVRLVICAQPTLIHLVPAAS